MTEQVLWDDTVKEKSDIVLNISILYVQVMVRADFGKNLK